MEMLTLIKEERQMGLSGGTPGKGVLCWGGEAFQGVCLCEREDVVGSELDLKNQEEVYWDLCSLWGTQMADLGNVLAAACGRALNWDTGSF